MNIMRIAALSTFPLLRSHEYPMIANSTLSLSDFA